MRDVSAIPEALASPPARDAEIGVIAVPAEAAQRVAAVLAENGVGAILNFAPVSVRLGGDMVVGNVDLAIEIENAPEVKPDFSMLLDVRRADVRSVTSAGVRRLAERPYALAPESRRGVVVPDELSFGMARMYEALRDKLGGAIRIFRDFDEAKRWVTTGAL